VIDQKYVGEIDGFEIGAYLVEDEEGYYYGEEDDAKRVAAENGDWFYVGTVVTASKNDIVLGQSSLWGSEYGWLPGVEGHVNPLDGEGEDFVNGYGPDLISEAIEEAKAKLADLTKT
jgi:hypothetical protein